jgi:hypothetical protein
MCGRATLFQASRPCLDRTRIVRKKLPTARALPSRSGTYRLQAGVETRTLRIPAQESALRSNPLILERSKFQSGVFKVPAPRPPSLRCSAGRPRKWARAFQKVPTLSSWRPRRDRLFWSIFRSKDLFHGQGAARPLRDGNCHQKYDPCTDFPDQLLICGMHLNSTLAVVAGASLLTDSRAAGVRFCRETRHLETQPHRLLIFSP